MKIAWQTYVVHIVVLFNFFMGLIAVNVGPLGISNVWFLLIIIPFLIGAGTYAANQLKAINSPPPGIPLTPETAKPADRTSRTLKS